MTTRTVMVHGRRKWLKVYLSGGIAGMTFEEANVWRSQVTEQLRSFGIQALNPLRGRMFLGTAEGEDFDPNELVQRDLRDIRNCDLVLVHMELPSLGTSMEIWQAHYIEKKPVILVTTNPHISGHPWVRVASTKMFADMDKAIEYIVTRWADVEEM